MILVAPDGFKGSMSAREAAGAIARGLREALPDEEVRELPMTDGGEGFLDVMVAAHGASLERLATTNALGDPIEADVAILDGGRTVAVELSSAAGLAQLARDRRDPMRTTTYGVGCLIREAYERHRFSRLLLALGGSATVDGGSGILEALSVKLLDAAGRPLPRGGGGLGALASLDLSDLHPALRGEIVVAVDVDNPLVGPRGAAHVYGPQKGATPEQVGRLDASLGRLADVLARATGTRVHDLSGAGSAGGVPAGLVAIAQAHMKPGFELAAEALSLDTHLAEARLVVTGEGQLDLQSFHGKVVGRLAARGVPLVVLAGRLTPEGEARLAEAGGVAFALADGPLAEAEAFARAPELLQAAARRVGRLLRLASPSDGGSIARL